MAAPSAGTHLQVPALQVFLHFSLGSISRFSGCNSLRTPTYIFQMPRVPRDAGSAGSDSGFNHKEGPMRQCVSSLLGFTAVCLVSSPVAAQTSEAACAAYDVHLLTKIEDLANEGTHGSQPAEWFTGLQTARALCRDQRAPESIALYTGMDQLLPQPQMSTASTAARYRPMPHASVETAATTASTMTVTIPPQEAGVASAIDLY